jgi:hypothetical protein
MATNVPSLSLFSPSRNNTLFLSKNSKNSDAAILLQPSAKDEPDTGSESSQAVKPHGITRGARYYGGKQS